MAKIRFLKKQGTNKHVHIVRYSRLLNRMLVANGDNHKRLWISDPLDAFDFEKPQWKAVNKFHIQMGGYTSIVESDGRILFGTDYQGGTNFLVETRDGKKFTKRIMPLLGRQELGVHDGMHEIIMPEILLPDPSQSFCLFKISRPREGGGKGEDQKVTLVLHKPENLFKGLCRIVPIPEHDVGHHHNLISSENINRLLSHLSRLLFIVSIQDIRVDALNPQHHFIEPETPHLRDEVLVPENVFTTGLKPEVNPETGLSKFFKELFYPFPIPVEAVFVKNKKAFSILMVEKGYFFHDFLTASASPNPIANAVYNAIGVRIRELPITPDRVLAALSQAKRRA